SCPSGSTKCSDNACSRIDDTAHCGASCTMCSGTQSCMNGACVGGNTGGPSGGYWNANGTYAETTTGNADVTVNDTSVSQTWEGFGGAFNEAGWSYLSMLSTADQSNAMQLLFGVNGAHFARGRIPIGASDYALQRYTDDET